MLNNSFISSFKLVESAEWRSQSHQDDALFTPQSRPKTITEMYHKCEPMPALEKLQVMHATSSALPHSIIISLNQEFRTDDVVCIRQYSDPGMFFNDWRTAMLSAAQKSRFQRKETKLKRRQTKKGTSDGIRKEVQPEKIVTLNVSVVGFVGEV